MGKVRIESVKRVARNLQSRYPDYFNVEFNDNKEKMKTILLTSSKGLRNRVAGYMTHLMKIKAQQERSEGEIETGAQEGDEEGA